MPLLKIKGIPDDRPDIGKAILDRYRSFFQVVLKDDSFWTCLPGEDKSKLEWVRRRYEA